MNDNSAIIGPYIGTWSSGEWFIVRDVRNNVEIAVVVQNGKQRSEGQVFPSKRDAKLWMKENGFILKETH